MTTDKQELNKRLNKVIRLNLILLLVPLMKFLSEVGRRDLTSFMKRVMEVMKEDQKEVLKDYIVKRGKDE